MRRRHIATLALASWLPRLWATEPQRYDTERPLYLEGPIVFLLWADPQPYFEMLHRTGTVLPSDLARRRIPPHKDAANTASLLRRAALPLSQDRRWQVNLPGMGRLSAWNIPQPRIDQVITVIGFPGPLSSGTRTLRPEIIFVGDRVYPVRADPA